MDSHFIWSAILTIGMAVISGFLRQVQKTIEDRMNGQNKTIEQVREGYRTDLAAVSAKTDIALEDLGKFKILVQRDFVSREEYIRTIQSLDAKIDRLLSEISLINVNMAKLAAAQEVRNQ